MGYKIVYEKEIDLFALGIWSLLLDPQELLFNKDDVLLLQLLCFCAACMVDQEVLVYVIIVQCRDVIHFLF